MPGARFGSKEHLERAGSVIHDRWLERNSWAQGGDLDVPYAELPKAERDKDTDQVKMLYRLVHSRLPTLNGERSMPLPSVANRGG